MAEKGKSVDGFRRRLPQWIVIVAVVSTGMMEQAVLSVIIAVGTLRAKSSNKWWWGIGDDIL